MAASRARFTPPTVAPESLRGDLVPKDDPRFGIIWVNPERMGGAPCFFGTRVLVQTLFDYLAAGDSIDDFLEGFPPITREHVLAVLDLAQSRLGRGSEAA